MNLKTPVMIRTATALIQRYSHVNWALADQSLVSGVNFLTGILLARYLGVEEFGRFTLAWMSVLFVASIQHSAINSPMMSIGPKQNQGEAPFYYGAVFVQQLIFSCAVFFLLFGGVLLTAMVFPEWRVENLALPLAAAAFVCQFQDFLRRYFFTKGRGTAAFANDAIRYVGQITLLFWMIVSYQEGLNTADVLWMMVIVAALATLFGMFGVEPLKLNAAVLGTTTFRHWHFSKWLTGSALMQWTTGNLFIITAGALLGATVVGALRATKNLMGLVHILFLGLENIVPVRASRDFHAKGKKALSDYLKRVTLFGGSATVAVFLIVAVAPDFWLSLFFGDQYIGYGTILRWWAAIYLLIFLKLPLTGGLRAVEQPQAIFSAYLWTTVFSVLATYPMTAFLGLNGVLAGIMVVNAVQLWILWSSLKKKLFE